jgi:hypothetical protein
MYVRCSIIEGVCFPRETLNLLQEELGTTEGLYAIY